MFTFVLVAQKSDYGKMCEGVDLTNAGLTDSLVCFEFILRPFGISDAAKRV